MVIKSWPLDQRPREKLLARGPQSLTDTELLAVILRTGVVGKSAIDLGQDLMNRCGGIHQLLEASAQQLTGIKGLGLAKRAQLQAVLELAKRALAAKLGQKEVLTSSEQVKDFLRLLLAQKMHEVFLCLYLDTKNCLIASEELFRGSLTETAVYPREIVRQALHNNAAALIVAHNHPSGLIEPSDADISLTLHLQQSLALIEVRLLDHFIVANTEVYSFAEAGLL